MQEVETIAAPPIVETAAHPPEYVCAVLGAYMAVQANALWDQGRVAREELTTENISRLSDIELRQLREKVAEFWVSENAKNLSEDFIEGGRIHEHTADIADKDARLGIAEIARTGLNYVLDQEYEQRIEGYREKCRAKMRDPQTPREDIPKIKELRSRYSQEAHRVTVDLTAFIGQVREFIDSDWARANKLGRRHMLQLLTIALQGDKHNAAKIEAGISTEIALQQSMDEVISEMSAGDGKQRNLRNGTPEEDARGGDIIYQTNGRTFYIDSKNRNPNGYSSAAGFLIEPSSHRAQGYDYKMYIWPSNYESLGHHAVADNFAVLDPSFKSRIVEMVDEADNLSSMRFH
ncbi:hypothetical protein KW789_02615 [Candidatus Saccharibacteria bacterium]|jgi:hypothetical protein|nr:hypothetical protein [Candidatus Saccharibacteria bacterium]